MKIHSFNTSFIHASRGRRVCTDRDYDVPGGDGYRFYRPVHRRRESHSHRDRHADTHVTKTSDQGYYSIEFIRVGTYNNTAEREGFQKVTKTGVVVENNQVVRADIALSVGAVNQAITVEADAGVIKTDDASVSEIITTRTSPNYR
jgi:hypothetical protein